MDKTRSGKSNPWSGAIKKMDPEKAKWQNAKYEEGGQNGKGSGRRPENIEAIRENWDQIDWGRGERSN